MAVRELGFEKNCPHMDCGAKRIDVIEIATSMLVSMVKNSRKRPVAYR